MMFVNDIYLDQWFQQDGATAHTSLRAREWLTNQFGNKIISHYMEFPWPARSPDLSPLDYFLWGYVKKHVLKRQPADIEILKFSLSLSSHFSPFSSLGTRILQCENSSFGVGEGHAVILNAAGVGFV